MEIRDPNEIIVAEPIEDPFRQPAPSETPAPSEAPVESPDLVPA